MFLSSTYWSDTVGIRAAVTTLQEIRSRNTVQHIATIGNTMRSQLEELGKRFELPMSITGLQYNPTINFLCDDSTCHKLNTIYIQEMAKRGIHTGMGMAINGSHGDTEIQETTAAAEQVFSLLANGLADNDLDKLIECEQRTDAFRRLVQ